MIGDDRTPAATNDRRAQLRAASIRGARWISIARVIAELATFAASIPLARLIPPEEFGRAAVAMIVVALAAILGPAGLTAPIVQRRQLDPAHVTSAYILGAVCGLALAALTALFALFAAASVFDADTADLVLLAAPAWVFIAVGAVSHALLQRELRFRPLALTDSASIFLGAAAAVILASAGLDAEAIILGALVTCASGTAITVVFAPPAWSPPNRRAAAEIASFGSSVSMSSIAYVLFRNVDYAILGARMSATNVGLYWRAYQLGVSYQGKLSQIMLRLALPIFSRADTMDDMRWLRGRIVRIHATVLVPLLAGFAAIAPVIIPWVYGSAWEPAVLPAQILTLAGIGDALTTGLGPMMVAIGRPGVLLVWNLAEMIVYAALIYVLAPLGLTAVCIGVASFAAFAVAGNQVILWRFVDLSPRDFVDEILPGLAVGAGLFASLTVLSSFLDRVDIGDAGRAAVLSFAIFAIGAPLLRLLFPAIWRDLVSVAGSVSGRTGRPVPTSAE